MKHKKTKTAQELKICYLQPCAATKNHFIGRIKKSLSVSDLDAENIFDAQVYAGKIRQISVGLSGFPAYKITDLIVLKK